MNVTANKPYMNWEDVAAMFHCGRSKAMLLMHEVGVVYIGQQVYIRSDDLDLHLREHGSIDIKWPRRKTKGGRNDQSR